VKGEEGLLFKVKEGSYRGYIESRASFVKRIGAKERKQGSIHGNGTKFIVAGGGREFLLLLRAPACLRGRKDRRGANQKSGLDLGRLLTTAIRTDPASGKKKKLFMLRGGVGELN